MKTSKLSEDQNQALEILSSGQNCFLTGSAGSGKSFIIKTFIKRMEAKRKRITIAAPTGLAAINVGGSTLHRLFGIPFGVVEPSKGKKNDVMENTDILIIDEISMVRVDIFEHVVACVRRSNPKMQLIFVGDFSQLPPVITEKDRSEIETHFPDAAEGFCFLSKKWAKLELKPLILMENHRQSGDKQYMTALNKIRRGEKEGIDFFNRIGAKKLTSTADGEMPITISTTNKEVNKTNEYELKKLSDIHLFEASKKGKVSQSEYPAEEQLKIAVDARVMMLVNNHAEGYHNGTLGTVVKIDETTITVKTDNGESVEVKPHTWEIYDYVVDKSGGSTEKEVIGTFTQLPLRLGYAVTVHKSQGQSFDRVCLKISRCFAHGQLYVALSRGRTLEGLSIEGSISYKDLIFSPIVRSFNNEILNKNGCPLKKYQPALYGLLRRSNVGKQASIFSS